MDALSSVRLIGSFRFVWIGSGLVHLLWPIPRLPLLVLSPSPTLEVYRINRRAIHFSVRVCVLIKHIELKTKTNVEDEMPETDRADKQTRQHVQRPASQPGKMMIWVNQFACLSFTGEGASAYVASSSSSWSKHHLLPKWKVMPSSFPYFLTGERERKESDKSKFRSTELKTELASKLVALWSTTKYILSRRKLIIISSSASLRV